MSETKHARTPWEVNKLAGSPYSEAFSGDTLIFDCRPSGLHWAEIEANAAFIVRAVNNHDSLLAACRDALAEMEHLEESDHLSYFDLEKLKAAIAKAEQAEEAQIKGAR